MKDVDWIDERLDAIEHLNSLRGDAYIAEAQRLGFVVTEKGLFVNPDHPGLEARSVDECVEKIKRQFAKHGFDWSPNPDSEPAS